MTPTVDSNPELLISMPADRKKRSQALVQPLPYLYRVRGGLTHGLYPALAVPPMAHQCNERGTPARYSPERLSQDIETKGINGRGERI